MSQPLIIGNLIQLPLPTLPLRVLVACESSGRVRDAFRALGHDAMSADLLPTEEPGPHYEGNVLDLLGEPFDLVIAHPPCTYLSNSGVRWLWKKGSTTRTEADRDPERWANMEEGAAFFAAMFQFNAPRIAVENPIQHSHARERHGYGPATQYVQPWMFGHPEKKATGLWLKNLPMLTATNDVREQMKLLPKSVTDRVHYMSPGEERWRERSRTLTGLAEAMALQWGHVPAVPHAMAA